MINLPEIEEKILIKLIPDYEEIVDILKSYSDYELMLIENNCPEDIEDLRNAIIDSDVVINASSTFGGIEIYVPSNVKIKIKSMPIFGGVENKAKTKVDENSYTIYINGTAVFGGVEIK